MGNRIMDSVPDCEIRGRLRRAGIGEHTRYIDLYRTGVGLRLEGVAFFRPSADLRPLEVDAMRLGHSDGDMLERKRNLQ